MRGFLTKTELARRAAMIQRGLCAYDIFPNFLPEQILSGKTNAPSMCDCKYGAQKPGSTKRVFKKARKRVKAMNKWHKKMQQKAAKKAKANA